MYKSVKVGGFGQSGACNINVLCPLGNGWEPERNSVALGLSGDGTGRFSGSMIMNTCGTNRPFFLTANHVYNLATPVQNVSGWRFTFQAWSPTCTPSQNSDGVTYNGSTLRANWANSDFCLVELNTTPPTNSGINYAGWTRSTTPAQNATGIHHPRGDVMKISRANNTVTRTGYYTSGTTYWQANWSPQNNGAGQTVTAVTERGSSGSPLFDQNHRIIGQLHGGPSVCSGSQLWDYYGSFDVSWTGGGTNATRLSNWLDPSNTGAVTTTTTNIALLTPAITGDDIVCTTSNLYTITNLPLGATVQWQATPAGVVTINTPTSPQTTLTKNSNGIITLTATISNACGGQITVQKNNIRVGGFSSSDYPISGPSSACNNQTVYFSTNDLPGATNYQWTWSSSWTYVSGQGTRYLALRTGGTTGSFAVTVRVANACDAGGSPAVKIVQVNNCGFSFTASPNPSTGSVTVSTNSRTLSETNTPPDRIYQLKVTDQNGNVKKQFSYSGGVTTATINLNNLIAGIYTIQAYNGSGWSSQQIVRQ